MQEGVQPSWPRIHGVRIYSKAPDAHRRGQLLFTLERPEQLVANTTNTFTAPPEAALEPNTTYFVRVMRPGGTTSANTSRLDAGEAHGWQLVEPFLIYSGNDPTGFKGGPVLRTDILAA